MKDKTVHIPEKLHTQLKREALNSGRKFKELVALKLSLSVAELKKLGLIN